MTTANKPGRCESWGCVYVDAETGSDNVLIGSTETAMSMFVTPAEFAKFRDEMKAGKYDNVGLVAL